MVTLLSCTTKKDTFGTGNNTIEAEYNGENGKMDNHLNFTNVYAQNDLHQRIYLWEEGALDLAHAVRNVRSRAVNYGIKEKNIAVMGFSAGGILCGELLLNFDGWLMGIFGK